MEPLSTLTKQTARTTTHSSPEPLARSGAQSRPIALDLFAGAGGWSVACQRLGIEEFGVELMPEAKATRHAAGFSTIYDDVWEGLRDAAIVPPHRLLIASPPCQSFSTAGQGSGRRALDDVLRLIDEGAHRLPADGLRQAAIDAGMDDRTALVLSPLAYIWRHRPEFVALEQVPTVLPVWRAYATVLKRIGYSVEAGNLHAEQYGVPQTRKRAILVASRVSKAALPTPTHSKYHSRSPQKLDEGVLPWVSMAEALGWGLTERPAVAVGNAVGRGLIGGQGAKDGILRAMDNGAFIDSPHGDGTSYAERTRITEAEAGVLQSYPPYALRSNYGTNGQADKRGSRDATQPAATITSKANRMLWVGERGQRRDGVQHWPDGGVPAPTIAGDPRIAPRGCNHIAANCCRENTDGELTGKQFPTGSVRLTQEEAQTLQAFPPAFPFQGTKTKRFLQVGNACPPLLAEAILRELMGAEA